MEGEMKTMKRYLERASFDWSKDSVRLIHTPSQAIKKSFFYIQEIGYFKTIPPYFTERENLDSFLIVLTLSGSGRLICEGREYTLGHGDIFWINCMNHHYYECLEGEEWEFLWFHFHGLAGHGYYQTYCEYPSPVIHIDQTEPLAGQIREMIRLTRLRDSTSDIRIADHINHIITELLLAVHTREVRSDPLPAHIKAVVRELEKRFQEPCPLDNLARQFGISKYYLLRQFKKHMGMPILEYQITLRINHAKELLKYSDQTVNEIAISCGMPNASYFIRTFQKREGKTPLKYRGEWQSGGH